MLPHTHTHILQYPGFSVLTSCRHIDKLVCSSSLRVLPSCLSSTTQIIVHLNVIRNGRSHVKYTNPFVKFKTWCFCLVRRGDSFKVSKWWNFWYAYGEISCIFSYQKHIFQKKKVFGMCSHSLDYKMIYKIQKIIFPYHSLLHKQAKHWMWEPVSLWYPPAGLRHVLLCDPGSCPNLMMSRSDHVNARPVPVALTPQLPPRAHRPLCMSVSSDSSGRFKALETQEWKNNLKAQVRPNMHLRLSSEINT